MIPPSGGVPHLRTVGIIVDLTRQVMNMPLPSSPGPAAELVRVARAKTLDSHEKTESQQVQFQRTLILCFDGTANQYNNQNTV